ncbi:MAG: class I SAM-dependent methyltransferase [Bacteroidetes bacterium]|nr:class I SAM-dependent methyltransferase [Bacteroidota bacterium]
MFEFHQDRNRYFQIQYENAVQYVLPFIEKSFPINSQARVLEIGAGEGGVLRAFTERGCKAVGVELDPLRVEWACGFLWEEIGRGQLFYVEKDIYDTDLVKDLKGGFDVILLKDVIEHIHDQPKLFQRLHSMLNKDGVIFFGFPPWQMPFGGHQQLAGSFVSRLPYVHLLPLPLYRGLLKLNGEPVADLLEIRQTRITIERFESICEKTDYRILQKIHYLINPIYQWKFGWKAREQFAWLSSIPWLRNYFTTCVYYLIKSAK